MPPGRAGKGEQAGGKSCLASDLTSGFYSRGWRVGGIKGWEGQLARINILQNFKISGCWPLRFIIPENSTYFAINISGSCTFCLHFLQNDMTFFGFEM